MKKITNGGIQYYSVFISYHKRLDRKGVVKVDGGNLLPTHVKLNGNLYWQESIIVNF